jgi:hypothetical protein
MEGSEQEVRVCLLDRDGDQWICGRMNISIFEQPLTDFRRRVSKIHLKLRYRFQMLEKSRTMNKHITITNHLNGQKNTYSITVRIYSLYCTYCKRYGVRRARSLDRVRLR